MLPLSWHIYDHYAYAVVALGGTFLALLVGQWFIQRSPWAPWARSLQGVAPPFINIVGVLFGLTLAFLANDTWSAHDRAMSAVYKEADSLRSLAALSMKLADPVAAPLQAALVRYAAASVGEWPALARRSASTEVSAAADDLLTLIASKAVGQAAGANVQALMLNKAIEIRDQRDQRIALSQTHVNPLKWLGMGFLGWLTLLSVVVVHVDRPRAAFVAALLFALAAAPTAAIVLIQGNPFQQPSNVSPAPIAAALAGLPGSAPLAVHD